MWTRSQRQSAARLFFRRLGMLALLVVVVFGASKAWDVYQKERESRALRDIAERERDELLDRQKQLRATLDNLLTNRGLEEVLREQYSLAREGEELIIIVEPATPAPLKATSTLGPTFEWLKKALSWW